MKKEIYSNTHIWGKNNFFPLYFSVKRVRSSFSLHESPVVAITVDLLLCKIFSVLLITGPVLKSIKTSVLLITASISEVIFIPHSGRPINIAALFS